MRIQKTKITVTVLHDADVVQTPPEYYDDLGDLQYKMSEGGFIGSIEVDSVEDVDPANLEQELIAIGNDGTFFKEEA
jgi:hypothetical protein